MPRQKVPIGVPALWKDFVTLSRLFGPLMRAPCIVSVNRAHLHENGRGLLERQHFISVVFQLCCFRLGHLICYLPWKFSLSSLPYLGSIVHLAGTSHSMENNQTFLYFAYGSNLLKERLQLKNPSAIIHCVARLKVTSSRRWSRRAASPITSPSASCAYFILFRTSH